MVIGIDFGTCFSDVAIAYTGKDHTNTRPFTDGLIPKDHAGTGMPSLYLYDESRVESGLSPHVVGFGCENIGYFSDDNVVIIDKVKRKVRAYTSGKDPLEETEYTGGHNVKRKTIIQEMLGQLLKNAIAEAQKRTTEDIDCITITVPCGLSDRGTDTTSAYYRDTLRNAAAEAYCASIRNGAQLGTNVVREKIRILEEPVAAALAYINSDFGVDKDQKIMVIDLGGGTLDVTVVKYFRDQKNFRVITKAGDLHLGGDDWDDALRAHVIDRIHKQKIGAKFNYDALGNADRRRFNKSITTAKIELSSPDTPVAHIPFDSTGREFIKVTRKDFDGATAHLLDRLIGHARTVYTGDVDKIVLVGGACQMPQIRDGIARAFKGADSKISIFDPSKAICMGAAYAGLKDINVTIESDVLPATYGTDSNRVYDDGTTEKVLANILYKDTHFPAKAERKFTPLEDDQTSVRFTVYESAYSESDCDKDGDVTWANVKANKFGLEYVVTVPSEYRGRARKWELYAEMVYSESGLLELEIYDKPASDKTRKPLKKERVFS